MLEDLAEWQGRSASWIRRSYIYDRRDDNTRSGMHALQILSLIFRDARSVPVRSITNPRTLSVVPQTRARVPTARRALGHIADRVHLRARASFTAAISLTQRSVEEKSWAKGYRVSSICESTSVLEWIHRTKPRARFIIRYRRLARSFSAGYIVEQVGR
ncbi:hypothetical protein PENSPDRAFT_244760 [Peniophora sp. CONT]|nr:hypothetical protein PENSPDRAFT_244760 [Peniophora sp. CONT]